VISERVCKKCEFMWFVGTSVMLCSIDHNHRFYNIKDERKLPESCPYFLEHIVASQEIVA